jgi:cystathionine beta-lyase
LQILKEENTKHTAMKFNTSNSRRQQHDPTTGAVMPLFSNVNICQTSPGKPVGDYGYSRSANPQEQLEEALASIENGARGLAFHRD